MVRYYASRLIALSLLVVGATTGWLAAQAERPAAAPSKVTELMRKRLELTGSLSGLMNNAFAAGQVSASACHESNLTYLDAEMEHCSTDAERIKVQQRILESVKAHESWIENQNKAGNLIATDVIKAQLHTLEAEIALERLKVKKVGY